MRKNTDIELGRALLLLLLLLLFGLIWLVCKGRGTLWSIHKDNWLWHPYVMAHEREKPRRVERIHELHTKQGQMCGLFFFKNNCQSLPWLHKVFFCTCLAFQGSSSGRSSQGCLLGYEIIFLYHIHRYVTANITQKLLHFFLACYRWCENQCLSTNCEETTIKWLAFLADEERIIICMQL